MLRYRPDLPTQISTGTPQRELTELLLAHGMDPNRREWPNVTPLHRFAEDADVENAAIFIAHGANIDAVDEEFETTPLGYAARFGRALMAAFLLRNGASLRPTGVAEWSTPIAWATRRGHQRVVDLLDRYDRDGSLPSAPDAVQIEALAMDLLAAYNGGDHDALRRFTDYVQPPRTELNQVRRHVRLRLGLPRDVQVDITIDQARELVRRMLGIYSPPDVP
jgi:ankyrin repeat protein